MASVKASRSLVHEGPEGIVLLEPRMFDPQSLRPWFLRAPTGFYLLLVDVLTFLAVAAAFWPPDPVGAVLLVVMLGSFSVFGLYRPRLSMSILDDSPYVVAVGLACLTTELALSALLPEWRPREHAVLQAACLTAAVLLVRGAAYAAARQARRRGRLRHTTLVIGAGEVGIRIARTLRDHPDLGLDPVGFVDTKPRVGDSEELPVPLLGGYEELAWLIDDFAVETVVVAYGSRREADLVEILRTCDRLEVEILIVPRLFEVHTTTRDMDQLRGIPLIRVRRAAFRTFAWKVKRVVDVVLSAAALLVLSPVMAVCALAVRWEGGPGIIFRQTRVGLDGQPFEVMKFRSLKPVNESESATNWNIKHDDRLGPVGRLLRRSSLDELPQLWNILRGDMSIVGPRPERPHFVGEFTPRVPRYMARHRVPAGLTGWAQVNGLRGDTSIEERASFDNFYIENWSLWGDFKIMVRTVTQVVGARGG
ncbi:sugar transferase [Kineococcus indalonis]|uniref:sugar transferase n=1 Tax=Kineococcus indalonis TaxID=2696566 RepID=UPI0014122923|nr:sugar transferase [Kineococcus indalonis]NAZ86275.1 exopolysaccharide biosynthesis polyprenyl glycosylphosphotransferase [Kineococcus indalonis]